MKKLALCLAALLLCLTACKTEPVQPTTTGSGVSATVVVMTTGENGETDASILSSETPSRNETLPFQPKPLDKGKTTSVSAQLAEVAKDGTGKVRFGMQAKEIRAILRQEKIPFVLLKVEDETYYADKDVAENDAAISFILFEDGTAWQTDAESGLKYIFATQTAKGLKIGDTVLRMKQLYGEPQRWNEENLGYGYSLAIDVKMDSDAGALSLSIVVDSSSETAVIRSLQFRLPIQHEGGE